MKSNEFKRLEPRVFHGPYDVGGNAYYLSRGERTHKVLSETIVYFKQWFGYPCDIDLQMKPGSDPLLSLRWWAMMAKVLLTADVVHFNFGGSFLTDFTRKRVLADLPLLKELGIATFVTFQGCDSRISTYALSEFNINACANCRSKDLCGDAGYNFFKQEILAQVGRYFDGVFALNPDLMHNIEEARFLPYSNCDIDAWRPPHHDWSHPGPLRVLHAPTWRELKGTDYIIAAVEKLRAEGEDIQLDLVENIPHNQVRRLYESCDILVDQVLVGWYGGLAVELMALGKPVMAYIRADDLKFIPADMAKDLPVISVTVDSLADELRRLIHDRHQLSRIGAASRLFVEQWHDPVKVAKTTVTAYKQAIISKPIRPSGIFERAERLVKIAIRAFANIGRLWLTGAKDRVYGFLEQLSKLTVQVLFWICLPFIRIVSFVRLFLLGTPSSLWGVTPILTIPLLSTADKLLGFNSKTFVYTTYHITKNFDISLQQWVERTARYLPFLLPFFYRAAFLYCLFRFDVFHFFYDQGILPREGRFGINKDELIKLRVAGKRVYLYAYGADVRTRSETFNLGGYHCCLHCDRVMVNCICDSEEADRKQAFYRQYATALLAMGDMVKYVPDAIDLHYWPIDIQKITYVGVKWDGHRPLRILHAPNHAWAKGSWLLEKAVQELADEGVPFELVKVSKMPNHELMRLMDDIDIIADQFLIGFYGYTALEGMAKGKIVLCYIRDSIMLLGGNSCPILQTHPERIKQTLLRLVLSSPAYLENLGLQSRNYVEHHHSVDACSKRLGQLYLDTAGFSKKINKKIMQRISQN
ncbi:MAG: hypothetical protein JNM55_19360 [Anaerolineales bacterium]|nr:hypothetical protein [Anaerolineales bacterium]